MDSRFALVLGCFLLSGFAGLLYETAWTREFSFVFGTSGLAVSTVLAAYMGGLALGSALAGRFVSRVARPVLVYGVLELGIALSALAVPWAIAATRSLHVSWLEGVTDPASPLALAVTLGTSFAILCVPTTFMGATLPLLARHAVRDDGDIGPRVGALYAINTTGAILGTLVTAFVLMPAIGLRNTVFVGAGVNALVFLGAVALSRDTGAREPDPAKASGERAPAVILTIAGVAGVASFTYEVMWVRLIEHVIGGSVYAFSAMLASFLIGIAGGGAIASRIATTRARARLGLALTQIGAAVFSLLAYHAVSRLPDWLAPGGRFEAADALHEMAALAALLLLPSTLCLGAMLPLAVRAAARVAEAAASASASVYAWNTLGAIVGSVATGFLLLPALDFAGTLVVGLALNLGLALLAWASSKDRSRGVAVAMAGAVVLGLVLPPTTPWSLLRSTPLDRDPAGASAEAPVLFHALGRSASVLALDLPDGVLISTNGMPESLIMEPGERPGRAMPARWLGLLPALAARSPERMLMIGLGGSVALESIPSNVREIDVVELEPEVVAANRAVDARRQIDVAADPRVRIRVGDARTVLELETDAYDAIVSQPSHSWTAGASHLYTRDFFERVKGKLREGGVFVQWVGLPFVDGPLLRSFVATLDASFGHVRLYRPTWAGALFVASDVTLEIDERFDAVRALDPDAFHRAGIQNAAVLRAALTLDEAGVTRFGANQPIITDDWNAMATQAPWVRDQTRKTFAALFAPDSPFRGRMDADPLALVEAFVTLTRGGVARQWVATLPEGPERALAEAYHLDLRHKREQAKQRYASIMSSDDEAAAAIARVAIAGLLREDESQPPPEFQPGSPGATLVAAWDALRRRDHTALAALDDGLARIDGPTSPPPIRRLARAVRIEGRLRRGRVDEGREALALIDDTIGPWDTSRLADRALAAALVGDRDATIASIREYGRFASPGVRADRRMMRAFRSVSDDDFDPHTLEQLRRRVVDPTQR